MQENGRITEISWPVSTPTGTGQEARFRMDIARVVENSIHEHGRLQGQPRFELDYGSADSNAIIPIAMRAREHHTRRNNDLDHQVPPLAAINCLNNGFQGRLHDRISTAITTASLVVATTAVLVTRGLSGATVRGLPFRADPPGVLILKF